MPFVLLQLISIGLLSLFPSLVTWLPGVFFG
jgi:TRAP-type mannitol/chloroaromatic compound transport system permease large subunit